MQPDPVSAGSGADTVVNHNFRAVSPSGLYGIRPAATSGLVLGYYGGAFNGVDVADSSVTLTASATNYVVANKTTGAVTASTGTTNWLDTANYLQLYEFVAGTSSFTITSTSDKRQTFGLVPVAAPFTGGTLSGSLNEAPPVTIASATAPSAQAIGAAASNTVIISGTTTQTGFDTIAAGAIRRLRFTGALILTHNATTLILPGSANITTAAGDVATMESLGSGNWRCIDYARADGTAVVGGGGAVTGFTASLATASPNDTANASALTASGGTTNQVAVLAAKGSGATMAQVPTSSAAGGNVRGTYATDWQKSRGAATNVAQGSLSTIGGGGSNSATAQGATVPGGENCTASGQDSFATGSGSTASSSYSAAIGVNCTASGQGALALGYNSLADADNAHVVGRNGSARGVVGADVVGGQFFAAAGDNQVRSLVQKRSTTNATPADVVSNGTGSASTNNQLTLPSGSAIAFEAIVVARQASTGDAAMWTVRGLASNQAGTVTVVGTPTVTQDFAAAGATTWVVAVTADNTNKAVKLTVTGEAAKTIRFVSNITGVEVVG